MDEVTSIQVKREREKARELRKSRWWQNLIQRTSCYYCQTELCATSASMDHVVPLSQGGRSTPGNVVPACKACNTKKRDLTAVEWDDYLKGELLTCPHRSTASSLPGQPETRKIGHSGPT